MDLAKKIHDRTAKIAVIGIGYVGLPLSIEIARAGFETVGIDTDESRVAGVHRGKSFIGDIKDSDLAAVRDKFTATTGFEVLASCDIVNICVPTPFTTCKDPDLRYIKDAGLQVAKYFKAGQLVVLRSTSYPGTTEEFLAAILSCDGNRKVGSDYYLSFVPERLDPGSDKFNTKNTPVVVGGVTKACTDLSKAFYETFVDEVIPVSSPRVAEMSKLLENIFRSVNIALVNEMAMMCEWMGNIDVWEVIKAASSKPFGYKEFHPGPGIGGHCILIDPYYLAWKAREYGFHSEFIELAAKTNESMPDFVAGRIIETLGINGIASSNAKLLILGVAFKGNVEDTRHSPAIEVMKIIQDKVSSIEYHDPLVSELSEQIPGHPYKSVPLTEEALKSADLVVILTDHKGVDPDFVFEHSRLILDARNAIKRRDAKKLYTLGNRPVKR
ncbi:MAG TPA: nucleotide sugar dehydrogenase [Planctomycetota bacterium]|nr:nucleotide sugar dehydrogenase [Planctomycetota bacterium]